MNMKHKDFVKNTPQRLADGSLTQEISYCFEGVLSSYTATGEDLQDLERDWAFKYLELFG